MVSRDTIIYSRTERIEVLLWPENAVSVCRLWIELIEMWHFQYVGIREASDG